MKQIEIRPQKSQKDFKLKDAVIGYLSLNIICVSAILILIIMEVIPLERLFSFEEPILLAVIMAAATIGLLLFGITLTKFMPAKYMEESNVNYLNLSILSLFVFMFLGALFEELLFRGIIQNLLFMWIDYQWISIIAASVLFLAFHVQYYKKPFMLMNIAIPSLTFGWIYFETSNILVPIVVHFLMNFFMTLLLKNNVIAVQK